MDTLLATILGIMKPKNLSQSKFIWQVESTFKTLNQLTGQSIRFFRFPYGSYENDQKDWLKTMKTANFFLEH